MANWSQLPEDINDLIVKRLVNIEDVARYTCVCKPWQSAAIRLKQQQSPIRCFAPLLMLAKKVNDKHSGVDGRFRSCYSFSSNKLFNLVLPEAQGRRCFGTSFGWIVTFGLDRKMHLLHPISRVQIALPLYSTFPYQFPRVPNKHLCRVYLKKVALASNPSLWSTTKSTLESSSLVMAIYGDLNWLAVASLEDKTWRTIASLEDKASTAKPGTKNIDDITFFNGHFYALSYAGVLLLCEDLNTTKPKSTHYASPPDDFSVLSEIRFLYLINLSGALHLVAKFYTNKESDDDDDHEETTGFLVYKLDFTTRTWIEVGNLGHHALFVGNNSSFAIRTSEYPEFRANCIYFTDDHETYYRNSFCNMGVYDIMEDTIEPFYLCHDKLSEFSRPLFFMPTF